jgi:hypothetical protein
MTGRIIGNLILTTTLCVVIFWIFMALKPARAETLPHKFVTECRSSYFYGMVTTKCYEIDVTQRWLDWKAQEDANPRESDSHELLEAKKRALPEYIKRHPLPSDRDTPEVRAAKQAAMAKLAKPSPQCTINKLDCIIDEHGELRDPVCPSASGLARLRPCNSEEK